jgi:hypothetical protein
MVVAGGSAGIGTDPPSFPDWATSGFASSDPGVGSVGASMPYPGASIDVGGVVASADPSPGGGGDTGGDTGAWVDDSGGAWVDDSGSGDAYDSGGAWVDDSSGGATDCPDPAPDPGSTDDGSFFDDGCPDCLIRPPPPRPSCPR